MLNKKLTTTFVWLLTALTFVGCTNSVPKTTSLFKNRIKPIKLSTKNNLAVAGGTAVSGGLKVKFSMGYNQGAAAPGQVAVASGALKIRASSAGVIREE